MIVVDGLPTSRIRRAELGNCAARDLGLYDVQVCGSIVGMINVSRLSLFVYVLAWGCSASARWRRGHKIDHGRANMGLCGRSRLLRGTTPLMFCARTLTLIGVDGGILLSSVHGFRFRAGETLCQRV
jgi:hypothetical protein